MESTEKSRESLVLAGFTRIALEKASWTQEQIYKSNQR